MYKYKAMSGVTIDIVAALVYCQRVPSHSVVVLGSSTRNLVQVLFLAMLMVH